MRGKKYNCAPSAMSFSKIEIYHVGYGEEMNVESRLRVVKKMAFI